MATLQSAVDAYQLERRLVVIAIAAARRAWSINQIAALTRTLQVLMARAAANASHTTSDMLAEQGIHSIPTEQIRAAAFGESASDGRPLGSLLQQADSQSALVGIARTQVADAYRGAQAAEITVRPEVTGYVRMLNPPSCSRCTILAGAFYRWNEGFLRHPQCDCIHIPASEATANDLTTNPNAYFDSLSEEEQNKTFTKDGAQAIRDGADISQVVNARRGMDQADVFHHYTKVTREGVTRRGVAGRRIKGSTRLMPEAIYQIASDREDAIRLLKYYGFIL